MILDCTLRDGGYYTKWDFSPELVDSYIEATNNLPIDYIEIGYRSPTKEEYLGEYFYCPNYILDKFYNSSSKKIAIMLNEKDIPTDEAGIKSILTTDVIEKVNLVRIAVNPERFDSCLALAKVVKSLGLEVAFNLMYMSDWNSKYDFIYSKIEDCKGTVDFIYMVDSFGGVLPGELLSVYNKLNEAVDGKIKIGFHGHNNLEMGLINSITAKGLGADIIDATFTGMGRGAGNLKMELYLTYLNSNEGLELNYDYLSKIVEGFEELQRDYNWGTQLPYMVSGAYSLPQKKVMEWVSERWYSMNSIVRGLLSKNEDQFEPISSETIIDNKAIIIGGGDSVKNHIRGIKSFIMENEVTLIFTSNKYLNDFNDLDVRKFHCLIGNEGLRLENQIKNVDADKLGTALVPSIREMGAYIPEAMQGNVKEIKLENRSAHLKDSATYLALEFLNLYSSSFTVYFIGYDGYDSPNSKEQFLFSENLEIFRYFELNYHLYSLVPTKYNILQEKSVYSLIQ
jgi:4-hydroxy 2-oxovalerate aldolase